MSWDLGETGDGGGGRRTRGDARDVKFLCIWCFKRAFPSFAGLASRTCPNALGRKDPAGQSNPRPPRACAGVRATGRRRAQPRTWPLEPFQYGLPPQTPSAQPQRRIPPSRRGGTSSAPAAFPDPCSPSAPPLIVSAFLLMHQPAANKTKRPLRFFAPSAPLAPLSTSLSPPTPDASRPCRPVSGGAESITSYYFIPGVPTRQSRRC